MTMCVFQESNWPLLHVSKGFMERAMQPGAGKAGPAATSMAVEDMGEEAAWGDEAELILDEGHYQGPGLSVWVRGWGVLAAG